MNSEKPAADYYIFINDLIHKSGVILFKKEKRYETIFRKTGSDWIRSEHGRNYTVYALKEFMEAKLKKEPI